MVALTASPSNQSGSYAGQRFGRYVLHHPLGAGGMASVYLGQLRGSHGFERLVALKQIHPHLAREEQFVEMFLDEARIAARITHPNVCAVYDFGDVDGAYFIALEYLSGLSLRDVLKQVSREPETIGDPRWRALTAYVIHEAAEGLHAAHETLGEDGAPLGVVHRDVSPHNVFVTFDGAVKLLDFGVARARGRIRSTETGSLKGKLAYMAPEHADRRSIDRRADVWGLGVVLWEMLTGRRLFRKGNEMNTLLAVQSMPIPAPSEIDPGIPESLDRITLRALARDVDERYPTARELARDLGGFVREQTLPATRIELSEWLEAHFREDRDAEQSRLRVAFVPKKARGADKTRSSVTESEADDGETVHADDPHSARTVADALDGSSTLEDERPPARRTRRIVLVAALALSAIAAVAMVFLASTSDPADSARAAEPAPPIAERPAITREVEADAPVAEVRDPPDEPAAVELTRTAAPRDRPPREAAPRDEPRRAMGQLTVSILGGYADVYLGRRLLGQGSFRVTLPVGTHTLLVRPSGDRPAFRRAVTVRPGDNRATIPLPH